MATHPTKSEREIIAKIMRKLGGEASYRFEGGAIVIESGGVSVKVSCLMDGRSSKSMRDYTTENIACRVRREINKKKGG